MPLAFSVATQVRTVCHRCGLVTHRFIMCVEKKVTAIYRAHFEMTGVDHKCCTGTLIL